MLKNRSFQRFSSALFRKITRIRANWFKNPFINLFAKLYKIEWADFERQSAKEFENFNDFFTRELKADARPLSNAPIISPSDGRIAAAGTLKGLQFIEAKGHQFTLDALLADPELAAQFRDGEFATIYLSPRDYHRIHMPTDGRLLRSIHIPGELYSVSLKMADKIPTLFAENERLVTLFETEYGKIILILVGAINVSSIETVWEGEITPPYGKTLHYRSWEEKEITLKKGEELGRFNMGSTVIVITENGQLSLDPKIKEQLTNTTLKLGEPLFVNKETLKESIKESNA